MKILQGYDDEADEDEVLEFKEIAQRLTSAERVDEEELETFKVIDSNILQNICDTLKEIENILSSVGITKLGQFADEKEVKYCKIRITEKIKKMTLHLVWDKPEKQVLEVQLYNLFESFGKFFKILKHLIFLLSS